MKTVDNTTIESVLEDTEFEYLIEKFKSAGDTNLRNLTLLNNQGQLLNYLKNFEDDSMKVFRLQNILKDAMNESSKPLLRAIVIFSIFMIGVILIFVLTLIV